MLMTQPYWYQGRIQFTKPEEDWTPLIVWFLSRFLPREFFLATVRLHLHCLLSGVLGWVSVQHFEISADVRRAL
jgi:hypothetical protein